MCRSFKIVARLVFARMRALRREALLHFWHKTSLELYKYLMYERL